MPAYTSVLPPLMFSASSPTRPVSEAPNMLLMIREAQVSPEWEFSGHVEPPEFAKEMQRALGEKPSASQTTPENTSQPGPEGQQKKRGFWASLKRAFGGG